MMQTLYAIYDGHVFTPEKAVDLLPNRRYAIRIEMQPEQKPESFEIEKAKTGEKQVPTISMFYGILITLLFEDNERHHLPHIHARYQGSKASIAIEDGRVLAGSLPNKQLRLVQAWVEIHREELFADWELALAGEEPFRIDPLKQEAWSHGYRYAARRDRSWGLSRLQVAACL